MGNLGSGIPRSYGKERSHADSRITQRRPSSPSTGCRDRPESVVAIRRNAWSSSIGMTGRDQSESLVVISRCAQVVLKKRGICTSRSALWRFFGRHDITFKKKSLCASERQRQDVMRARRKWIRSQGLLDPARLVFIDETSVNTQMVRLYGHGPRGVRLVDHVPFGNRKTFTFVAALRHDRMVAPLLIDGAMNGETFRAYIEQFVVPILKPNDIVAIDNLPAHNVAGIEEMINAVGATLRYLPKYSPDLNPIELPYSKFKAYLRKLAARTVPSLHRAIRSFLHILKPRECANYYKHAGYRSVC